MLSLARKVGQKIVIDGNIVIVVKAIEGSRVTLGIDAPLDVKINRLEVEEKEADRESR